MSRPTKKQPRTPGAFDGTSYPPAVIREKALALKQRFGGTRLPVILHRAAAIGLDILTEHPELMTTCEPVKTTVAIPASHPA